MVLLPLLTFKNYKQKIQSFVILFLSPNSRLTGRQHPLFIWKKEKVYYKFLYFLLVHFIGANLRI